MAHPGTGTGLGFTISRTLVDSVGGDLTVESRGGGPGAQLRVKLRPWAHRTA